MMYPSTFPIDRNSEHAEKKVYERLRSLSDKYDVFYSRKFITDGIGKKPEFEIDFIIALPEKALVCIEVKGGLIDYSGADDVWKQNGHRLSSPISQVSGSTHSFLHMYRDSLADMPVMWALCFPDCEMAHTKHFPSSINEVQVIDALKLLHAEHALDDLFSHVQQTHSSRKGAKRWQYEAFKKTLLRGLGFVQTLSTRIKYDEERFIELTQLQLRFFKHVTKNKNILVDGPAGSGKTIIAKTLAQDFLNNGQTVLFMCFNRTLANKIRYEFDRDEADLKVCTFHSLSRRIIEQFDAEWWKENSQSKEDGFWDLDVPAKLEDCISFVKERYDALIIDEGQDFKEFWFELMFKLIKQDGHRLIFMDQMQNIFGHYTTVPNASYFIQYTLPENCRNTKNIVCYLSELVGLEIRSFVKAPSGEEVVSKTFSEEKEQLKFIIDEINNLQVNHDIDSQQVLILLNSSKADSCLSDTDKIGQYALKSLDNKGRFQRDAINYTTINTFKGLEADVVFVVDTHVIDEKLKLQRLYTQGSRGRHKLYVLGQ